MRNQFMKYGFLLCLLANVFILSAQKVTIATDKDSILIGDHITLSIEATIPEETEVFFPVFEDSLGIFDVVEVLPLDTLENSIIQDIIITQFDSGYYQLNGLPALFITDKIKVDTLYSSNPINIYVNTVPVDTAEAFMPIKPVRDVPYTWEELKIYVYVGLGILAGILIGLLALYLYQKNQKPAPPAPKTLLDYFDEARKALKDLDRQELWQKGETKEYYLGISEIVRTYIEGRYKMQAMESTTDEILNEIHVSEGMKIKLQDILRQSDLAKFAKFRPEGEENTRMMKMARDFVSHTKPKALEEENDELA